MSVWGLELRIAIALFVIILPLALWPLVYFHYRRHGKFRGFPAFMTIATFFYICGVVAFTLFPLPETNDEFCTLRDDIGYWQLKPFSFVSDIVHVIETSGLIGALTSATLWQVLFNVLLLLPLGFLLAYRFKKSFPNSVVIGFLVSLLIELTQGTAVWGIFGCPYRLADVDDLMINTAGVALGWWIGQRSIGVLPDPSPARLPDLDPPTVWRRLSAAGLDVLGWGITVLIAFVVEALVFDAQRAGGEFVSHTVVVITSAAIGIIGWLLVPMLRGDRATPGQIATWLALASETGSSAGRGAVAVRFAARWLVFVVVAAVWNPLGALAVVGAYELTGVILNGDRRSVSAMIAGLLVVTRRSLEPGSHDG